MCKIMEELIAESHEEGRQEGLVEMAISSVKSVMKSLDKASIEAMELLNIPVELMPQIMAALEAE